MSEKRVLAPDDVRRATTRMAHEIIERNQGLDGVVLIGDPDRWRLAGRRIGQRDRPNRVDDSRRVDRRIPLPRRHRAAAGEPRCGERHRLRRRRGHDRARRRRAVHRADGARCARRARRLRAAPSRSSSPCSSTAVTASSRSAPTSSARTCRPAATRTSRSPPTGWSSHDVSRNGSDPSRHASRDGSDPLRDGGVAMSRSLLSIDELGADGVRRILDLADTMAEVNRRPNPKVPALRGKTVCSVFFEDSTRTRLSFETAAKRLSADTMTFAVSQSSLNKGESLRDTIETIAAMGVDAFVIRHASTGAPWLVDGLDQRQRRQRRRRLACPPDPGSARRLHGAHRTQPSGWIRRTPRGDRRRHQAQPGRAVDDGGVQGARCRRHVGGAADAAPAGRPRTRRRRPRRRDRRRTSTCSTCCGCRTNG